MCNNYSIRTSPIFSGKRGTGCFDRKTMSHTPKSLQLFGAPLEPPRKVNNSTVSHVGIQHRRATFFSFGGKQNRLEEVAQVIFIRYLIN